MVFDNVIYNTSDALFLKYHLAQKGVLGKMSQSDSAFREKDVVSYKYNGMKGTITSVVQEGLYEISFSSQNREGEKIVATMTANEIELISGGSRTAVAV